MALVDVCACMRGFYVDMRGFHVMFHLQNEFI